MKQDEFSSLVKRVERLETVVFRDKAKQDKGVEQSIKVKKSDLDFSMNIRAFINKFAKKKSGSEKFVFVVAFLAKGEVGKNISAHDIKKVWKKISAKDLLGQYNSIYSTRAKTQGWVDSKQYGTYCLTNSWKEIL